MRCEARKSFFPKTLRNGGGLAYQQQQRRTKLWPRKRKKPWVGSRVRAAIMCESFRNFRVFFFQNSTIAPCAIAWRPHHGKKDGVMKSTSTKKALTCK